MFKYIKRNYTLITKLSKHVNDYLSSINYKKSKLIKAFDLEIIKHLFPLEGDKYFFNDIKLEDIKVIEFALNNGLNVNSEKSIDILYDACRFGYVEILSLLINYGMKVNEDDI